MDTYIYLVTLVLFYCDYGKLVVLLVNVLMTVDAVSINDQYR